MESTIGILLIANYRLMVSVPNCDALKRQNSETQNQVDFRRRITLERINRPTLFTNLYNAREMLA